MFGLVNNKRVSLPSDVSVGQLEDFAPYGNMSREALQRLAAQAEWRAVAAGKLPARWFERHRVYLVSGELQLNAGKRRRIFMSSVSPPARFPLPAPDKAAISAVEPVTVILVPDVGARVAGSGGTVQPAITLSQDPRLGMLVRLVEGRIQDGEIPLPSMPDLLMKLTGALRDGADSDSQDIARLIQLDPALSAKIIHVVNSAAFGFAFARRAESVQQAVTRLGRERVRNLAIGFLMRNAFDTQSPVLRKRANRIWLNSCHVAAVCFTLAQ